MLSSHSFLPGAQFCDSSLAIATGLLFGSLADPVHDQDCLRPRAAERRIRSIDMMGGSRGHPPF